MTGKKSNAVRVTAAVIAALLACGIVGCSSDSEESNIDDNNKKSDGGKQPDEADSSTQPKKYRPIVFVHGGAGSADQFESQAMRFVSNGYPIEYITGYEYDSSNQNIDDQIMEGIEALIDELLEETGAEQADLVGHSMGTMKSHSFLGGSAQRAAKVAHYVNIDGMTSDEPPGGVPTLAIYAGMSGYRTDPETGEMVHTSDEDRPTIGGATNVFFPGITHVQAATYAETFVEMYKFFNDGETPKTKDISPGPSEDIELAGRVVYFAVNDSPQNFTLEMYKIDQETGLRLSDTPEYKADISGNGEFGKISARAGVYYEFVIFDEKNLDETTQHFYYEPFIRNDYLLRLKTSRPDGVIGSTLVRREEQSNLVIVRNKEFVGDAENYPDEKGLAKDSLTVNGIELSTKELCPASNRTIGMFVTDINSDDETELGQWIDAFASIPFISGADVFVASSDPPDDPITIVVKDRSASGTQQMLKVPNWISTKHRISVQFNDFVQ
ncbi:MAG: hypothetical protein JXA30_18135 [Deltaproteobacteria bacterium]|nr:hypothetical protein [Deltaproteobacteria bacterium]